MKKNEKALKWLAEALDMEDRGEEFYAKAMSECGSEPGREIFRMLGADETIHKHRIKKIYESLGAGKPWSDEWKSEEVDSTGLANFFKKMTEKHGDNIRVDTTDLEAMDVGIDLELKAIKFYEERFTKATDPLERGFLNRMITEEHGHYNALSDMKFYLVDPVSWFRDKERTSLDGPT